MLKTDFRERVEAMKRELLESIEYESGGPPEAALARHAEVLDRIFCRLLSDADKRYDVLLAYNLALRAQNQHRRTLQLLKSIRKEEAAEKKVKTN